MSLDFCPKCGWQTLPESRFCGSCGVDLPALEAAAPTDQTAPAVAAPAASTMDQDVRPVAAGPVAVAAGRRHVDRRWLLGIVGVALVVVALVGAALAMRGAPVACAPGSCLQITYQLQPVNGKAPDTDAQAITQQIFSRRLESTGATGSVRTLGTDEIVVELPGVQNADAIRGLLVETGKLEFVPLPVAEYGTGSLPGQRTADPGQPLPTTETPLFGGEAIDQAYTTQDSVGFPAVGFRFKSYGAKLFADYTAGHVGEFFAIVLDNIVVSAPVIQSAITGGQGVISGGNSGFTVVEMNNLVTILQSGSLPFPVKEVSVQLTGSPAATTQGELPGGPLVPPTVVTPTALVDASNPRALGSAGAKITLEMWSDYQCPFCAQWAEAVEPGFLEAYVATGKARLVFRDFAFIDGASGTQTGDSHRAAVAARCAAVQNQFWPYHDWLFANQSVEKSGRFSDDTLAAIADRLGLNRSAFDACVNDPATLSAMNDETQKGRAVGVSSTPTLSLNGTLLYRTASGDVTLEARAIDGTDNSPAGGVALVELAPLMDNLLARLPVSSASPSP